MEDLLKNHGKTCEFYHEGALLSLILVDFGHVVGAAGLDEAARSFCSMWGTSGNWWNIYRLVSYNTLLTLMRLSHIFSWSNNYKIIDELKKLSLLPRNDKNLSSKTELILVS